MSKTTHSDSPIPPGSRPPVLSGPFDLFVAGGGINGTAIARDATLRGKSVLLVERNDFGSGTSGASSKMVHGGMRYLERLQLGLVYEALQERHRLLRLAPHLVRPQSFLIPVYSGASRGPRWIRLGLFLYDVLSLGRRLGKSRFLSPQELLKRLPELQPNGLLGGGVYYDGVMDDARLCMINAVAACEEGARLGTFTSARNYTELVRLEPGTPHRLHLRDRITGAESQVLAHRVVRALGPWSQPDLLVPSKGVHLVLPRLAGSDGLLLTHSSDGRVFFVIPWLGHTIVGTTETPFPGSPDTLNVNSEEVSYLLGELQRLLPNVRLNPGDILGVYAGVRPLARRRRTFWDRFLPRKDAGAVSRHHRIVEEVPGVLTVVGGKYTTYRAIAQDVVDRLFPGARCETKTTPLPGGELGDWSSFRAAEPDLIARHGEDEVERLFRRYGARLLDIYEIIRIAPELGEPLAEGIPALRAEVVYTLRHEFALVPADFLCRRTALRYVLGEATAAYDTVEELLRTHGHVPEETLLRAREHFFAARTLEEELRAPTGERS